MEEAEKQKLCLYCSGMYVGKECLPCERKLWSSNRTNGFVVMLFLLPISAVGMVAGAIWSAIRAGFEEGSGLWSTAMGFIRKKRP